MISNEGLRLYSENQKFITRRYKHLAKLLDPRGEKPHPRVHVHSARTGPPTLSVETAAGTIHVASTYNPHVEAERWAMEMSKREWNFAIVIGLGAGYHVEQLVRLTPNRRIFVIEPDPDVFRAAVRAKNHTMWLTLPTVDLHVGDDPRFAADYLFRNYGKELLHENIQVLSWPPTSRYAPDFEELFQSQLLDRLRAQRVNLATYHRFSWQWLDNFFANIKTSLTDPGITALTERFIGRPGIIASAGPSLEKNVHLLHQAKGKAVIIAAGSTLNPLLKHGIKPDVLVSFDPGKGNYRHFEHLASRDIPLVYVPTIYPQIIDEYEGPRFMSGMDTSPYISWMSKTLHESKGELWSGPSVANVSWHLARLMGLNPIIFVGQDLAYTDMKSHADGATHARSIQQEVGADNARYVATDSSVGGTVLTDRPMYSMKVWFEQRLAQTPPDHTTIDATEGGAKIEGTVVMPLAEALKQYCSEPFNPYDEILMIHKAEKSRLVGTDIAERLIHVYETLQLELSETYDLGRRGVEIGNALLRECQRRRLTVQRYNEAVIRLERYLKRLASAPAYKTFIAPSTEHIMSSVVLSIQARWAKETDLQEKGTAVANQFVTLFTAVRDTSRRVDGLIRQQNAKA